MRLIPLETVHQILAIFGITSPTGEYTRWAKEDGFEADDLYTVVHESPFVIGIDWRGVLPDTLEYVVPALRELGAKLEVEMSNEADEGWVSCNGSRAYLKFVPSDEDDFTDVIRAMQEIVPETIEFRAYAFNDGACGWDFAVLLREEWEELERLEPKWVEETFKYLWDV